MKILAKSAVATIAIITGAAIVASGVLLYLPAAEAASKTSSSPAPLKDAKLNIEHNATDLDTGFQGFVDSEGWKELTFTGPKGNKVLKVSGLGSLAKLGITELFFESVEPENVDVSIEDMLLKLPAGNYTIEGPGMENGESTGKTKGIAWLTHDIPAGPVLVAPKEGSSVATDSDLLMKWKPVTKTIDGKSVKIISYQLIIEKIQDPHPHMIGKINTLSMYLAPTVTSMRVPKEFLESGVDYDWEVLAIEESGNQTLSSGKFSTK
jgi:hypothetical protein